MAHEFYSRETIARWIGEKLDCDAEEMSYMWEIEDGEFQGIAIFHRGGVAPERQRGEQPGEGRSK